MLRLAHSHHRALLAHLLDALPLEGCGLLAGDPEAGRVAAWYPCRNEAASARVYQVDPRDVLAADRDAEARGLVLMGVVHSHTHTAAYPSPTDVAQAPDPSWHYVVVSLAHAEPEVRSYRIAGGEVREESVLLEPG